MFTQEPVGEPSKVVVVTAEKLRKMLASDRCLSVERREDGMYRVAIYEAPEPTDWRGKVRRRLGNAARKVLGS